MIDTTSTDTLAAGKYGGRQLILELQDKLESVLDPLIPEGSRVAVLDFPNNSNVGDSLIWLGESIYLARRGLKPAYVCDLHGFDAARLRSTLDAQSVILMHGGGNFGTLWPDEQRFRLRVLRECAGVPVVQFPQSIFFEDDTLLDETREAIKTHGNYTLLARDEVSYDFALRNFECKVALCPDMAFFIGSLDAKEQAPFDRFVLSRTDHESAQAWFSDAPGLRGGATVRHSDWLEQGTMEKILNRVQYHSARLRKRIDPCNTWLYGLYNRLAQARLARGKALLESGRVVIADRLHVHILAILMEKPHVLIDNRYRKLGTFHEAWTKGYRGVTFADNLQDAYQAAGRFDEPETVISGLALPQ
jgi:pyruvyl transferase EpsO